MGTLENAVARYKGGTLPKLVEMQIKKFNLRKTDDALHGAYYMLPEEQRDIVDRFAVEFVSNNWCGESVLSEDLAEVYEEAVDSINCFGEAYNWTFTDEECDHIFDFMVLRLCKFAHEDREFRSFLGIKRGWFT